LAPAQFLSSVDSADLNERMDRWVIENSIRRFCLELQNNKRPRLFISVTDSVWRNKELLTWLAQLLRDSRVEADHIVFQISENECSGNLAAAKYFVDGLRQLHCLTCLKHYGSSSDSEHILKLLDPDYIKFDASFTQELFGDSLLDSNFSAMLKQLEGRGKITIAPQVETPRVMSLLWKSGICMIQGYYLQAPEDHMDYAFF
ncbi:MAG: EAL domain-containing protein, partial [Pseudomonadales bacterium]